MKDPDGGIFTYTHVVAGNLIKLVNPRNETATPVYDALNQLVRKVLGNCTITSQVNDAGRRLIQVTNMRSTNVTPTSFKYTYDCANKRQTETESVLLHRRTV